MTLNAYDPTRIAERAALLRLRDPAHARWATGYGEIRHTDETQVRVAELVRGLELAGIRPAVESYARLYAADRITSAAMWLIVHSTYVEKVHLDGRDLEAADFKRDPEGHTGGALNMAPAYVGYLLADALTNVTRGWVMGQGHCVAAIDSANLLVANLAPELARRYPITDEGLSRFSTDYYDYTVDPDGRPRSPRGSHVNARTAGGIVEGGYLGFAELMYVHMPLPGERLVAFLSDGAFEEQRGSDWAPRWWRAGDSGLVTPILIANGRRIDQRTTLEQEGGTPWLCEQLRADGFDPLPIDGRDPAAFAWAIVEMEERLAAAGARAHRGDARYPVPLPYAIAETVKGYGFPGAGTNRAHNLPLAGNPSTDEAARASFNEGARRLWVPPAELSTAIGVLTEGAESRPREIDHPLTRRQVAAPQIPEPAFRDPSRGQSAHPMDAIDAGFVETVAANPSLRPRVGNPDELSSNRMTRTLARLRHRVTAPEAGVAEAVDGAIVTALNEEAVACAALANKGGINLVVSYEAFAVKMLGALRQDLIFARHQKEIGRDPQWIAVPLVTTSHTWENGKNEQSHQDPTLAEALLGEMSDGARVLFPADWNSAAAALEACYRARGEIWNLVVPKRALPDVFDGVAARKLIREGAVRVAGEGNEPLQLVAMGGYQLVEARRASARLAARGIPHSLIYLVEPGRFRIPRDAPEAAFVASDAQREKLFPSTVKARVILAHTRPEPLLGVLRAVDTGPRTTRALGYLNHGGTLDVFGMLYANRCTFGHALAAAAEVTGRDPRTLLSDAELAAVHGEGDPRALA